MGVWFIDALWGMPFLWNRVLFGYHKWYQNVYLMNTSITIVGCTVPLVKVKMVGITKKLQSGIITASVYVNKCNMIINWRVQQSD